MQATAARRFPHVPADAYETYSIVGELITFKVTGAETGGAFMVMELLAQPGGGPPLHTHPSAESFTILEGELEFTGLDDGKLYTIRATPGDTVFIPGGDAHAYQAVGATPGKALIVFTPGTEMERFFVEAGERVTSGQAATAAALDIPTVIAIAQKHGLAFFAPADQ